METKRLTEVVIHIIYIVCNVAEGLKEEDIYTLIRDTSGTFETNSNCIFVGSARADFLPVNLDSEGICDLEVHNTSIRNIFVLSAYLDGVDISVRSKNNGFTMKAGKLYRNTTVMDNIRTNKVSVRMTRYNGDRKIPRIQFLMEITLNPQKTTSFSISCCMDKSVINNGCKHEISKNIQEQEGILMKKWFLITLICTGVLFVLTTLVCSICLIKRFCVKTNQLVRNESVSSNTAPGSSSNYTTPNEPVGNIHVTGSPRFENLTQDRSASRGTLGSSIGYAYAFDHLRRSIRKYFTNLDGTNETRTEVSHKKSNNSYISICD